MSNSNSNNNSRPFMVTLNFGDGNEATVTPDSIRQNQDNRVTRF